MDSAFTPREAAERWSDISLYPLPASPYVSISLYQKPPMLPRLSGLAVEYQILEFTAATPDSGGEDRFQRGQGTKISAFAMTCDCVQCAADASVVLRVKDEKGQPSMASFTIRDRVSRISTRLRQNACAGFLLSAAGLPGGWENRAPCRRVITQ